MNDRKEKTPPLQIEQSNFWIRTSEKRERKQIWIYQINNVETFPGTEKREFPQQSGPLRIYPHK